MEGHRQAGPPTPGHQDKTNHSPSPVANSPFQNDFFSTPLESVASTQNRELLDNSSEYLTSANPEPQSPYNQHTFLQSQKSSPSNLALQKDAFAPDMLDMNGSIGNGSSFEAQFFSTASEAQNVPLDSTFLLDPQLLEQQTTTGQSVDPATLLNQMSATQSHLPSSPSMLQPDLLKSSSLTNMSPTGEPPFNQGNFTSPNGSRHTSLDPSTAAFPPGSHTDWARGAAFQHRRTPSDTHSDVSSSAVPSPFLNNLESFDAVDYTSPLLPAQQDQTLFPEMVQLNQFSLSEVSPSKVSPAHSPHVSPQLNPAQQPLPLFMASNNFGLGPTFGDTLTGSPDENPPAKGIQGAGLDYIGQADQTVTPQISIQFAPPSRQPSFEPERVDAALSPPPSGRGRPPRSRATSDPFVCGRIPGSSRSSSTHPLPSTRPSLTSQISDPTSLSPHDIVSRTSSRSPTRGRQSRSSSTSSIPRDYFIGLADPTHQHSTSGSPSEGNSGTRRTQKHPANFSCHLCTKRFTRAYNLRSHLRTHTDERPFVCNVCGKAFARQHDRKRHEGLHSGEKKFVCRGTLKDGGAWGCSRRFARADALGRHFRSEAGRICIKPLLEEESAERANKAWDGNGTSPQQVGNAGTAGLVSITGQNEAYFAGNPAMSASMPALASQSPGLSLFPNIPTPPGGMGGAGISQIGTSASSVLAPDAAAAAAISSSSSSSGYTLPAALLAQYPALAGIQWESLPSGQPDEIEGDISGRSSFDASSGGEWFEDEDESFVGGQQQQQQQKTQNKVQAQQQQTQAQLEQQHRQQQLRQQDENAVQQFLYGV